MAKTAAGSDATDQFPVDPGTGPRPTIRNIAKTTHNRDVKPDQGGPGVAPVPLDAAAGVGGVQRWKAVTDHGESLQNARGRKMPRFSGGNLVLARSSGDGGGDGSGGCRSIGNRGEIDQNTLNTRKTIVGDGGRVPEGGFDVMRREADPKDMLAPSGYLPSSSKMRDSRHLSSCGPRVPTKGISGEGGRAQETQGDIIKRTIGLGLLRKYVPQTQEPCDIDEANTPDIRWGRLSMPVAVDRTLGRR